MITLPDLYARLPEHEILLVDILRQIILENLPPYCMEKISFRVPFFYWKRGICIIWPASIPGGGIKSGTLTVFGYGKCGISRHFPFRLAISLFCLIAFILAL
jgi:hypothetical protein